jgi:hypothetical protein
MRPYKNEIVTVSVPSGSQAQYSIPTDENINSVTVITYGAGLNVGFNNPDYLTGTFYLYPNSQFTIFGAEYQKMNAPFILYADNLITSANAFMYVILKRFA